MNDLLSHGPREEQFAMSVVRRVALLVGLIASVACVACSGKPEVTSSASKSKEETGAFALLLPSDATPDAWALELAKAEKQVVDQGRRGAGYEDVLGPQFEELILLSDDHVQRTLGQLMAELGIDISRLTAAEGDSGRETSDDSVGTASQAIVSSAALFSSVYGILTLSFAIDANLTTSSTHTKQLPPEETTIAGVAGTSNVTTAITITPSGSHTLAELIVTTDLVARDALTGASRGFVKEVATALATLDVCPDADGIVQGTLTLKSEGQVFNAQSADGTEGVGFHSNVNGRFRYRVNDAAEHVGTEIEGATDYEAKGGRQPSGGGSPDLFSKRATAQWHSLEFENPRAFSVDAYEGDPDDVEYILKRSVFGLGMAALELARPAKKAWRGGTCVEVRFDRASSQVSPGETLAIVATPHHKIEGQELSTPIVPELNGKASLSPLGEAVSSPATLLYVAGSEPNDSGTITATSTSKRGIGTGTVTFTTRAKCGPCEHWDAAQSICVPQCDPSNCSECASYCVTGECDSGEWDATLHVVGDTNREEDVQEDSLHSIHTVRVSHFECELTFRLSKHSVNGRIDFESVRLSATSTTRKIWNTAALSEWCPAHISRDQVSEWSTESPGPATAINVKNVQIGGNVAAVSIEFRCISKAVPHTSKIDQATDCGESPPTHLESSTETIPSIYGKAGGTLPYSTSDSEIRFVQDYTGDPTYGLTFDRGSSTLTLRRRPR